MTNQSEKPMEYGIVESSVVPGEFSVEVIHHDDEGKISTVQFLSHDSKNLAEEYLAWKRNLGAK